MAKQSKAQQATMARVMHEFAHGELATPAGDKVTDHKQAVAIGLSESGSSDREEPATNARRLKQTEARERTSATARDKDEGTPTKAALYAQARRQNVPGRSRMTKAALAAAVKH